MAVATQAHSTSKMFDEFMNEVISGNPNEPEFHQAVREVAESVMPFIEAHPVYWKERILQRIVEPEQVVMFRVAWVDDSGAVRVNRGYRIQMNSALGPYKGGLRFHPTVNLSILKFLAFEQVFKNSLTGLPLGAGKGGSNFDPKGKSDREVMHFCQSFMTELYRHVGPMTDVPAGDIGVGTREIGYMFGQYKRIRKEFSGVLTGKGLGWGGSHIRPEATGYGNVYFVEQMLLRRGDGLGGKIVTVSGSGNVAQYTVEKLIERGAKCVTLSDSGGFIYDPDGLNEEKLEFVKWLKNEKRGRIAEYAEKFGCQYYAGKRPWAIPCHIAMPSATQNELDGEDAQQLVRNGCYCVSEGANMPCTPEAIDVFRQAKILFGPGKAANAGGVAVSGLEMSQNAGHTVWTREQVDRQLQAIMKSVHDTCCLYGTKSDGWVDYVDGANIGGFVRVANAMLAQGVV